MQDDIYELATCTPKEDFGAFDLHFLLQYGTKADMSVVANASALAQGV